MNLRRNNSIKTAALITSMLFFIAACADKGRGGSSPQTSPPPSDSSQPPPQSAGPGESSSGDIDTNSTTQYSYWLIQDGCSTEKHFFPNKDALCKGLQNKNANKNCAINLRQEKFKEFGCPGDFKEMIDNTVSIKNSSPSPIRCVGHVFGISGEKKIDKTIPWDRKVIQKIVLSEFADLKDAGEYSATLIPHEDSSQVGAIKIMGWFIDNSKIQIVEGRLDSGVHFYHKDRNLNGREVEIKCGLLEPDIPLPSYMKEDKLEMTCLGTKGPTKGHKDALSAHFFWDHKNRLETAFKAIRNGKEVPSDLQLVMEKTKETGLIAIRAMAKSIDGHVDLVGGVLGRADFSVKYMSAWDDRDIDIRCSPTKVWIESINSNAGKKANAPPK